MMLISSGNSRVLEDCDENGRIGWKRGTIQHGVREILNDRASLVIGEDIIFVISLYPFTK